VQEVEEVREAHKASASAQMAVIAEMAQSTQSGGKRNSHYWERAWQQFKRSERRHSNYVKQ
jgi:hypothetical protein